MATKARLILGLCLFEAAFYFAYKYGMTFSHETASPFWFPDSVLLCALLLTPPKRWWIFVLLPLPIRLFAIVPSGNPFWFALATSANDIVKGLVTATILRRTMSNPIRIETVRDYSIFCLFAVLLAPAASAFGGAAARQALGSDFWVTWEQWFLGDVLTQMVITPALLYWVWRLPEILSEFPWKRGLEAAGLALGLFLAGQLALDTTWGGASLAETRFFTPVPFLFWAAIRFGMAGASGSIALLAILAVNSAIHGRGPYSGLTPEDTAFALQRFLLMRAAPLFLFAVLIEQMKRAQNSLHESEERTRDHRDELAYVSRIAAVGELSAALAHELSQPLTAILNNTKAAKNYLAAKEPNLEEVRQILTDIAHDDIRAGKVIGLLRSLIRKEKPAKCRLDVTTVIRDVVALLHADAVRRNVRVSCEFQGRLPSVDGIEVQLQQVVLNLLSNSFEAMEACPVAEREVILGARLNVAGMVEVSVRDHGAGLSSEQLEKIFEPFYTTKQKGLGVGLSISRSIIKSHGGQIAVQNNPGGGATFYFTLPAARSEETRSLVTSL